MSQRGRPRKYGERKRFPWYASSVLIAHVKGRASRRGESANEFLTHVVRTYLDKVPMEAEVAGGNDDGISGATNNGVVRIGVRQVPVAEAQGQEVPPDGGRLGRPAASPMEVVR